MDEWFHVRHRAQRKQAVADRHGQEHNHTYVVQVETYLVKALEPAGAHDEEDEELLASGDGVAPPHFYGELVKTLEGQSLLTSKAHFVDFAEFIRRHGLEPHDPDVLAKLKSILWAVGNIGASPGGITFLENEGLVQDIVAIAEESQVFSVRGCVAAVLSSGIA